MIMGDGQIYVHIVAVMVLANMEDEEVFIGVIWHEICNSLAPGAQVPNDFLAAEIVRCMWACVCSSMCACAVRRASAILCIHIWFVW